MGSIRESGFLSRKYGAQIGSSDRRNLHALVRHQHDILSAGCGPAAKKTQQQH
jgi:hypothetical protein